MQRYLEQSLDTESPCELNHKVKDSENLVCNDRAVTATVYRTNNDRCYMTNLMFRKLMRDNLCINSQLLVRAGNDTDISTGMRCMHSPATLASSSAPVPRNLLAPFTTSEPVSVSLTCYPQCWDRSLSDLGILANQIGGCQVLSNDLTKYQQWKYNGGCMLVVAISEMPSIIGFNS
jgi:hypothetical protein